MAKAVPAGTIEAVAALLRETSTPGVSVAVKIDDGPIGTAGVGTADLAGPAPMPADARCYLYSVTKLILATAACALSMMAGWLSTILSRS